MAIPSYRTRIAALSGSTNACGSAMTHSNLDHLFLVAERREILPLIKKLTFTDKRFAQGQIGPVSVGVYITGVGKQAVKKSQEYLAKNVKATTVWNVGNVGALSDYPTGLILRIGRVIGQNGAAVKEIDPQSPFTLVTVNSLQDKSKLASQYPQADVIDMEAFHWASIYPVFRIVKVVLDRRRDKLRAPVRGPIWAWRIRRNARRLSRLLTYRIMTNT